MYHSSRYYCVISCRKENVLIVNLGSVKITSLPRDRSYPSIRTLHSQGTSEEEIMQSMISQSFDRFKLNLEQMQVCEAVTYHFKWLSCFQIYELLLLIAVCLWAHQGTLFYLRNFVSHLYYVASKFLPWLILQP
jgi:hypothetical protein